MTCSRSSAVSSSSLACLLAASGIDCGGHNSPPSWRVLCNRPSSPDFLKLRPAFRRPYVSSHQHRTVPRSTRLTKGMTPLAHPQEMPEISGQLGAWIHPPPPHHLSNIPSSPAAISGPLRPSLRRPSFEGTRQVSTSRGFPSAARSERALQVHEPRDSPAAMTTQPLVSAANTAVAIGWA